MRKISNNLLKHIESELTNLTTCWQIKLKNNIMLGFTEHDDDIYYEQVKYLASSGLQASSIEAKTNLAVDNLEISSMVDNEIISASDLLNGIYDNAEILIFRLNYQDISQGKIILHKGWLSEITIKDNKFFAEIRGIGQMLNNNITQIYSKNCRAEFGDAKCKIDLKNYSFNAEISKIMDNNLFYSKDLEIHNERLIYGKITFVTGSNKNFSSQIKESYEGKIKTILPFPYKINEGDKFIATYGCDKFFSTCSKSYKNHLNFRAEPYIADLLK